MSEYTEYTGMIIRTSPVGEYNKRLVILTAEAGKITAFARGARKVGNRLMGITEPFCFGKFKLLEGKDAYTLTDADISRHFEELRTDYDATVMASYFLEIADYYTRENMEAYEELNLIYASILALISGKFDFRLVKSIYEIRSLVIAGEFPGIPTDRKYSETTSYTVDRIVNSSIHELFTFSVSDEVIDELEQICMRLMKNMVDRKFNSVKLM
ncbi:DNA replication and repair protein RecO [Lachnospiraceae bacterium XBB2008]|nr:DNA repair protein RecO [Lachnospiraceae bacterium]SCX78739.1 DNA replication and repair protein RecO [Lachnospiraceae bacterium XBB2008]